MRTTKTITTDNGSIATFYNNSRGTRSGFAHDSYIVVVMHDKKQRFIASASTTAHAYYYNRTRERYTFQTAMQKAVYQLIQERRETIKQILKADYNKQRFTKTLQAKHAAVCEKDAELQELGAILQALQ